MIVNIIHDVLTNVIHTIARGARPHCVLYCCFIVFCPGVIFKRVLCPFAILFNIMMFNRAL